MVAFALMAPVVIGSAGMALDFAQAYLVQQRLAQALDAAALAAAASSSDPDVIEQRVQDFFDANYPPEELGIAFDPEVTVLGNQIHVSGHAQYLTFFLGIIGIDDIDVEAETTVLRETQGLEVALVLDNTGSMATNNNIATLKTATANLINVLFDNTTDPDNVRIGLVPYSNSVRVGRYGLGLTPDGDVYGDGESFVTMPAGVNYTTTHNSMDWYGCVVEHMESGYDTAATESPNSKGQLWRDSTAGWDGHGWNPLVTTNDPYPDDVLDDYEGPWDIYAFGKLITNGTTCGTSGGYGSARCSQCNVSDAKCNAGASSYCFCWKSAANIGINDGCPYANVVPLTSDRAYLLAQVEPDNAGEPDDMEPHGNTLGNIGMVWGSRLISPEPPFTEGHDWDNIYWRKAVVMMTDGDNTENATYSSFWFTSKNNMTVTKFNQRFEETCEELKEKGVVIYTVTFTSEINDDTKGYYRRCASSDRHYYDAPDQAELLSAFNEIARELSNLHIMR